MMPVKHVISVIQSFRIGRVNFQKVVEDGDPPVLKHFKHLVEARPITVISKDDSEPGDLSPDCPLIVSCHDSYSSVMFALVMVVVEQGLVG